MGYQDRDFGSFDSSEKGSVRRFFDRIFENAENPLGWSLAMFRFRGIVARIHLVTLVYIFLMLLRPILQKNYGFEFVLPLMISLFLVVLLHEFGHCFACRAVKGEADRIVMLPFGGLAFTMPPHTWKAHLITTVGGPAVNVALVPITSIALALVGLSGTILFNPFDPGGTFYSISSPGSNVAAYAMLALWTFHYINIVILGFNVLLPFFPLDGGRIVQELLWARLGYRKATEISITIGMAGAMVLAMVGVVFGQWLLLMIALFGLASCWSERQRLRADEELAAIGVGPAASGLGISTTQGLDSEPQGPSKTELKRLKQEQELEEHLDTLLAKIAEQGMQSLTGRERRTLDRLSKEKRSQ